jgi:SHAQKYF class myb-like DNA-binding protein
MEAAPETATASMEPVKRSRLVWTRDLHQRFEEAVGKAGGIDVAVPKTVLEVCFQVSCFASDNVASDTCL